MNEWENKWHEERNGKLENEIGEVGESEKKNPKDFDIFLHNFPPGDANTQTQDLIGTDEKSNYSYPAWAACQVT